MTDRSTQITKYMHVPVLVAEVLACLDPKPGDSYLDLTAGYGGHTKAILELTKNSRETVLVDRDSKAIMSLEEQFAVDGADVIHSDFLQASRRLLEEERKFEVILADLGVSSPHLNDAGRGFAINADGPLDMRMDTSQSLTAAEIVNNYSADELAEILRRYGEEPKANHIAKLIVQGRPFETTSQLAQTVSKAWPGHSKVHPATRTFQAIRIAVNNELGQLSDSLPLWIDMLAPGGRIAVVSFHSLEDRIVKQALQEASGDRYDAQLQLLTKHPITAGTDELVHNPRARSAKLRAAVKIKKKGVR